jgi:two-component system NtrC family sensor kinase
MSQPAVHPETAAILVIEDEPAVLGFVRTSLERHGYMVVGVASAAEALDLLKTGSFRGVVSDMVTPGGVDGARMHAWIASHRPDLAERVVFMTGDIANEETVNTLRKTGAPYLEKPFRVQDLISAVEKTMGKAL